MPQKMGHVIPLLDCFLQYKSAETHKINNKEFIMMNDQRVQKLKQELKARERALKKIQQLTGEIKNLETKRAKLYKELKELENVLFGTPSAPHNPTVQAKS